MSEYKNYNDYKLRDPERKDRDPFMIWQGDFVSLLTAPEHFNEDGTPKPKPEPMEPLEVITMNNLMAEEIPPVRWIVNGLISEGITFLSAPPKTGKSWLCLDIALSVACGHNVLGFSTSKCNVVYFALEDSKSRFQSRLKNLYKGKDVPPGTLVAFECERFDKGLINRLEQILYYKPRTGLIIIDTFQRIRPPKRSGASDYEQDYPVISALQKFAQQHHLAIVLVHHNRKDAGMVKTDPFDSILGSTALQGACDNMLVIRKNRGDPTEPAVLYSTSKDADEKQLALHFNKNTYQWENMGDAELYNLQQLQNEYERSSAVAYIKDQLKQTGRYKATAKEIRENIITTSGDVIGTSEKQLGDILRSYDVLFAQDGIRHTKKRTTIDKVRGLYHSFEIVDP